MYELYKVDPNVSWGDYVVRDKEKDNCRIYSYSSFEEMIKRALKELQDSYYTKWPKDKSPAELDFVLSFTSFENLQKEHPELFL